MLSDSLDEQSLAPHRITLRRVLLWIAVLLFVSLLMPVGRAGDAYLFVLARSETATGLNWVALFWPGVVALGVLALAILDWLSVAIRAGGAAVLLSSLPLIGISPMAAMGRVVPPISGDLALLQFGLVDGTYFPHEGSVHGALLITALILLGAAAYYRSSLNRSVIARGLAAVAITTVVAYYVVPYGGEVPISRNLTVYKQFRDFAAERVIEVDDMAAKFKEMGLDPEASVAGKRALDDARSVGQVKLTSYYFMGIYALPALLALCAIPSLWPSRYRGHRVALLRLAGVGAAFYLVAFLGPLLIKEGARRNGPGVWVCLRDLVHFVVFVPGLAYCLGLGAREALEGHATDDGLPDAPDPMDGL